MRDAARSRCTSRHPPADGRRDLLRDRYRSQGRRSVGGLPEPVFSQEHDGTLAGGKPQRCRRNSDPEQRCWPLQERKPISAWAMSGGFSRCCCADRTSCHGLRCGRPHRCRCRHGGGGIASALRATRTPGRDRRSRPDGAGTRGRTVEGDLLRGVFSRCGGDRLYRVQLCPLDAMGGLSIRRHPPGHARCDIVRVPHIAVRVAPERLVLDVTLSRHDLPRAACSVGLTAVIEEVGGHLSYWALRILRSGPTSITRMGLCLRCRRGDDNHNSMPKLAARISAPSPSPPASAHVRTGRSCFALGTAIEFGIDRLLSEPAAAAPLPGRRVALVAHPASVTRRLTHSLDALVACGVIAHRCFRPAARPARRQAGQHGRIAGFRRSGASASLCSASTARCAGRPMR